MYLDTLHVKNLKLLRDFKLSFSNPDGTPRMWTVLIGENGTAKTSILQAIGLTAAGSLQVNGLAKPVVAHLCDRRSENSLEVRADYRFTSRNSESAHFAKKGSYPLDEARLRSAVFLKRDGFTVTGWANDYRAGETPIVKTSSIDPLNAARDQNRRCWFVIGYGISRYLPSPSNYPDLNQPGIERLEPLFNNTAALTSLRFSDHFSDNMARAFAKILKSTLTTVEGLVPGLEDIELRGRDGITKAGQLMESERFKVNGQKVPAIALSHGYQSTIAWIADLIGHVMLEAEEAVEAAEMEGLVLIDEIDLYLHPAWQVGIISALRKTFPKIQFIATTHSPVVLASLAPDEIVRLGKHPVTGDVVQFAHHPDTGALVPKSELGGALPWEPDPRAMTGTAIYRDWFGIDRLTLNEHGGALRRYLQLATDPFRSDEEQVELEGLGVELEGAGIEPREPVERDA